MSTCAHIQFAQWIWRVSLNSKFAAVRRPTHSCIAVNNTRTLYKYTHTYHTYLRTNLQCFIIYEFMYIYVYLFTIWVLCVISYFFLIKFFLRYEWFKDLDLRWYALPAVSNMRFDCGGIEFTANAFNGWYMATEIACRDICDVNRLNMTEVIFHCKDPIRT